MGFFNGFKRSPPAQVVAKTEPAMAVAPNPWAKMLPARTDAYGLECDLKHQVDLAYRSDGFFSSDVGRLLSGWETVSNSIDYYLQTELRQLRARSRRMVRMNPYGKRFITTLKSNVIGPNGITIQAQSMRFKAGTGEVLDTPANDAIEAAFKDWAAYHCDYMGRSNWVDLQNMAISCAGQDGEFIFQKFTGREAGKYGYQLKSIDPELLNVDKNSPTQAGEIRLGVEYDATGRIVRYHFRRRLMAGGYGTGHDSGNFYSLPAENIIHGFISEWPDQSRGVPWMHSSLERSKHLEKYDEAAIVNARAGASTMAVLKSQAGDEYTGSEQGTGEDSDATLDHYEAGTIKDIGDRDIVQLDPDYPHQMYADFVKSQLRGIASGLGISYHALSNDLEGVNYSSIRAGVLEDREIFKGLQNWFIRGFIRPVYDDWVNNAILMKAIRLGPRELSRDVAEYRAAHYQPRRWAWVDPQKDGVANQLALASRLKSRSQIMREQGDDPESVWREIQRDQEMMDRLGIAPVVDDPTQPEKDSENA
jgi:lambda family phage portal protein